MDRRRRSQRKIIKHTRKKLFFLFTTPTPFSVNEVVFYKPSCYLAPQLYTSIRIMHYLLCCKRKKKKKKPVLPSGVWLWFWWTTYQRFITFMLG